MLEDLAETVKVSAELSMEPSPIPYLDLHKDREAVLAATQALLAVEKADEKELKRLVAQLKDFKDTTLWELMLGIMRADRSEEHTSELQSLMRISYAVFCLKKKKQNKY